MRRTYVAMFEVSAPARLVWDTFWEVPTIAACIPGCESIEEREPLHRYDVRIRRKVGPFLVRMEADVSVIERHEPTEITIRAHGQDHRLRSDMVLDMNVRIDDQSPTTQVTVVTEVELSGLLVSLGERLIGMQIDHETQAFADALRDVLAARGNPPHIRDDAMASRRERR